MKIKCIFKNKRLGQENKALNNYIIFWATIVEFKGAQKDLKPRYKSLTNPRRPRSIF